MRNYTRAAIPRLKPLTRKRFERHARVYYARRRYCHRDDTGISPRAIRGRLRSLRTRHFGADYEHLHRVIKH